ncbi:methyltransferase, putative [Bodo saltans]|uniref:Methyltransferase, putative n=1 Tax=Bodo saltans TaxID=75058 RepID=A0A0S4JP23_BODSA|nr:methyltransferase, putative [Bodo saltans]|eukprot:CUG93276.1 methyltransferase, putative [Bodo saltans]
MPNSTAPQLLSTPENFLSESLRRWMSQYQFIAHTHVVDALSHRYIEMLFPTRPAASASLVVDSAVVKLSSSPSFLTTAQATPLRNSKSLECSSELCLSLYRHVIVDQHLQYPSDDEEKDDSRDDSVHDAQVATVLRRFVQEILTGETRRSSRALCDSSHNPAAHHHQHDDDADAVVMAQFRDACETFLLSRRHVHDDRPHAALLHVPAASQQPAAAQHLLAVGTSVKKRYEIDVLAPFIHGEVTKALDALNTSSKGADTLLVALSDVIIVDIGAGQGYLSAQLAVDYGYTVVAVEREGVQLCGSIKRSQVASLLQDRRRAVKSGGTADGTDAAASVNEGCLLITDVDIGPSTTAQTLLTNVLAAVRDHESIVRPTSAGVDNNGLRRTSVTRPVVLISLHACGPLSTNMLRLYADWQMAYEEEITLREPMAAQRSVRPFQNHPCIANVNVGCCYTYLQGGAVDGFPISQLGRSVIAQCPHGFQGRPERRRSGAASAAAVSGTDLAVDNENLLPPHHLILTRNMAMAACQAPWRWFDDYDGVVEENTNDRNSLLLRKSKRESSTTADNNNTRLTLHEDVAGTFSSLYLRALLQRYLCHGLGVDDLDVIGRVPAPQSAATTTATTNAAAGGAVSGGAPPKKPVHQKN